MRARLHQPHPAAGTMGIECETQCIPFRSRQHDRRIIIMAEDLFSLVETRSGILIFVSAVILVVFFVYRYVN